MLFPVRDKRAPLQVLSEGEEGLFWCATPPPPPACVANTRKKGAAREEGLLSEPRSVLENRRSLSPPSSASSTLPCLRP